MKLNEILLIGGALLAALVLSKNGKLSSKNTNIPFINPFTDLLSKAQAQAIEKQESNIGTLENIKSSNLGIAQDILDYERNISDVKIFQVQTELDKTQSFISQEQKYQPSSWWSKSGLKGAAQSYLNKFDKEFAFYQTAWTGEKGPLSQKSLFPDVYIPFSQATRAGFAQQARYESAQENIAKSNQFAIRQQGEIDRLQEEYQTRFGGISRYG